MKSVLKSIRIMCTLLVGIAPGVTAAAQDYEVFSFNSTIEPSVETFTIAQYGKLEPSLYTGTMSYSLPLYVYEDPDFTIPISLDYSFNGYKPSVHSGTVGYGWALNCGGSITREVKGLPDDAAFDAETNTAGYYHAIEDNLFESSYVIINSKQHYLEYKMGTQSDLGQVNVFSDRPMYIREHKQGIRYDANPDIFNFNFMGYTGSFMLTKTGAIKVFNSNHPHGEISVSCNFIHSSPREDFFSEIVIETGNGYSYYFGGNHQNVEFSGSKIPERANPASVSGWKLRRIIAPNGNTVDFIYSKIQKDRTSFEVYTPSIEADYMTTSTLSGEYEGSERVDYTNTSYYSLLTNIKVNDEEVIDFSYSDKEYPENSQSNFNKTLSPICDPPLYVNPSTNVELRLDEISIKNLLGNIVDKVELTHEYCRGQSTRMLLSSVSSLRNGTHLFDYNKLTRELPKNDTYATDHWGYWNGLLTPGNIKSYISGPTGVRCDLYNQLSVPSAKEPNEYYSKVCGLSTITYPTGGYSRIYYEANYAKHLIQSDNHFNIPQNDYKTGGVRVSKIENISDEISDSVVYTYNNGVLMYMPRYATKLKFLYNTFIHGAVDTNLTEYIEAKIKTFGYTEDCNFAVMRGPHMAYASVIARYPDYSYTVYNYCNASQTKFQDSKIYSYDSVNDVYSGLTVYAKNTYFSEFDSIYTPSTNEYRDTIRYTFMPNIHDYSAIRGKLQSVEDYDRDDQLTKRKEYSYRINLEHSDTLLYNTLLDFTAAPLNIYGSSLDSEIITEYSEEDHIYQQANYSYNSKGQQSIVTYITPTDRETKYYRYYWEAFPNNISDALENVVSNVVMTKEGHLVSGISFQYSDSDNPQPSKAIHYSSSSPTTMGADIFSIPQGYESLTAEYEYYDNNFRLKKESFPGGRYYKYMWDNQARNVVSIENSHTNNITEYLWKDLIGLTQIKYPTNAVTYYIYDSNNRLSQQKNTDNQIEKKYKYYMVNQ